MSDNPFTSGIQKASVGLPELQKATYKPNDLANALGNFAVNAVGSTITQKYKMSYEEGKEQVLFDENTFESIIQESKETPWYLKAFGANGKLDGAREAQYTKALVQLRSELEESMPNYAGLPAKDYDKFIVSKLDGFMTEDEEFNNQLKRKAVEERLDLINKQQQLHADYRIKESVKTAVELYSQSSNVSSDPLRQEALADVTGIINSPSGSRALEALEEIVKVQVINGDSSMIDGLIASQRDHKTRESLIKMKEQGIDLRYQRGTERYDNQVTDAYIDLKLAVNDPKVTYKQLVARVNYAKENLGLDSKNVKRFSELLVSKDKHVRRLIASNASKGLSLAQKEASQEELLIISKRYEHGIITTQEALDKLRLKQQRGEITEAKYLSEAKKIKSKALDTSIVDARVSVEEQLSSVTSFKEGLELINQSGLTPKQKRAVAENWESMQTEEGRRYLKLTKNSLDKIPTSVLETYSQSDDFTPTTRKQFNDLLQKKRVLDSQVANALINVSSVSPLNEEAEKSVQYQIVNGGLPMVAQINGINKTEAPQVMKDDIKFITSTMAEAESLGEYDEQLPSVELMVQYRRRHGVPKTISKFGLNVEGQRLLNAIESRDFDIEAGLYAYRNSSIIDSQVSNKDVKKVTEKVVKATDNPMASVYATDFIDGFLANNPTASTKELEEATEAFIEENSHGNVIGLNKRDLYDSPLGYVDDLSELASEFYNSTIADEYVMDSFETKITYEPSSKLFIVTRIHKDTGEAYTKSVSKELMEAYYKGTGDYKKRIEEQQSFERELKEEHERAKGDRAL